MFSFWSISSTGCKQNPFDDKTQGLKIQYQSHWQWALKMIKKLDLSREKSSLTLWNEMRPPPLSNPPCILGLLLLGSDELKFSATMEPSNPWCEQTKKRIKFVMTFKTLWNYTKAWPGLTFGRTYWSTALNLLPPINFPGSSGVKLTLNISIYKYKFFTHKNKQGAVTRQTDVSISPPQKVFFF